MLHKNGLSILGCVYLLNLGLATAQITGSARIDSLLNDRLQRINGLSLVLGIYSGDQAQLYYLGEVSPGSSIQPDSVSVFELGALSSVFTNAIFAGMTVKGEIPVDDPLEKYLPVHVTAPVYQKIVCEPVKDTGMPFGEKKEEELSFKFTPFVCLPDAEDRPQPILLCYLSTHTSGLPATPFNLKPVKGSSNPYENYSKEDLYDFLRNYRLLEPIGYDYKHSDLGIVLLGHVLSLHSKMDYNSLIHSRILEPLGMNNTGCVKLLNSGPEKMLQGYSLTLKKMPSWNFDIYASTLGMKTTAPDMMRFLQANIGKDKSFLHDVLDYTHNPRILLEPKKDNISAIALGWKISPSDKLNKNLVWNSGLTGGFASYMGFEETTRQGIVLLSNCALSLDELGQEIMNTMLENVPK